VRTKKRRVVGAVLGLGCLVALSAQLPAQAANGKRFEFSTSISIWEALAGWAFDLLQANIDVPTRFGFYVYKGLEFEPELFLTFPAQTGEIGILAFGNVAYNWPLSREARFFVLGGVGIANGAQVYSSAVDRQNGVLALDLGAGVKRMIAKSMAARLEYRFISYSVPASRNWNDHTFLAGISIFF